MVGRLQKTADMIDATRRVLICRTASPIMTDTLWVANLSDWLREIAG